MSVSALARSAECEQLLSFAIDQKIDEFWGDCEDISCYVNGCRLGNSQAPGDLPNPEFIVHLVQNGLPELGDGGDVQISDSAGCAIHLSTLLALATAHVKYQYEAVAAAIRSSGNPAESVLDKVDNANEARAMAYSTIIARSGVGSAEEREYYYRYGSNPDFLEEAHRIRLNYRMRQVVAEEQQAKIDQRNRARPIAREVGVQDEP